MKTEKNASSGFYDDSLAAGNLLIPIGKREVSRSTFCSKRGLSCLLRFPLFLAPSSSLLGTLRLFMRTSFNTKGHLMLNL